MPIVPAVELKPIEDRDIEAVAGFLHRQLNQLVTVAAWTTGIATRWLPDAPNHGFMLTEADQVVGAALAFYSAREVDGRSERICNLGALCVLESRRAHTVRLVRAVLRQRSYTFTDLSPSGNVVELNRRLGFRDLDAETMLLPHWPVLPSRSLHVVTRPDEIDRLLSGRDRQIFRDHRDAPAARHLVLTDGTDVCYVVSRRVTRKRLPLFTFVLYVGHAELFRRGSRQIGRHFLLRGGTVATLLETRIAGRVPGAFRIGVGRPKMMKSTTLAAEDVDYLYSELTQIAW